MQRTEIYLEQDTPQELKNKKTHNLNDFLETMKPLESFAEVDATAYVQGIRKSGMACNFGRRIRSISL